MRTGTKHLRQQVGPRPDSAAVPDAPAVMEGDSVRRQALSEANFWRWINCPKGASNPLIAIETDGSAAEPMPSERRDYDRRSASSRPPDRPNQCPQKEGITTRGTGSMHKPSWAEPMPSERRDYDTQGPPLWSLRPCRTNALRKKGLRREPSTSASAASRRTNALRKKGLRPGVLRGCSRYSCAEPMPSERRDYDVPTCCRPPVPHAAEPMPSERRDYDVHTLSSSGTAVAPNQCPQKEGITTTEHG